VICPECEIKGLYGVHDPKRRHEIMKHNIIAALLRRGIEVYERIERTTIDPRVGLFTYGEETGK
jgi:hypothetical protein